MAMWGFIPMPSAVAAFIVTSCGSDGPAQSGSIRASFTFFPCDDLARRWKELLLGDDELRSLLIKQKKAPLGL
jgi:hypothetical protein